MPVLFTCPHCSAQTLVDDCYIGASGPCATCGKSIRVEAPEKPVVTRQRRSADPGVTNRAVRVVLAGLLIASLVGSLFLWVFVALILPEMRRANRVTIKQKTRENLALIGAALRAYHDEYGVFPPAVTRDAAGNPMHSWRVLLLPYLGEDELYRAYHLNEPWDGPHNSTLHFRIPLPYRDPADEEATRLGETLFLAICGDGSAFPRDGSISVDEILDGAGDTVLIAESANNAVCWTEPVDLQITRMSFEVNKGQDGEAIKTIHGDGPIVLLADGTIKELRPDATSTQLRGLVTIHGAEAIHWEAIQNDAR